MYIITKDEYDPEMVLVHSRCYKTTCISASHLKFVS